MSDILELCVLFGGGIGTFAIGLWGLWSDIKFFKTAIKIPGVITGYKEKLSGAERIMYQTIATFEFDGKKREVIETRHASSYKPTLGKPCQVGINPYNIQEARIYSKMNLFFYVIFIALGLLMIGIGVSVFKFS